MTTAEAASYLRWKKDVDGYHRLSLAYALDPYAVVPLKLGGVTG